MYLGAPFCHSLTSGRLQFYISTYLISTCYYEKKMLEPSVAHKNRTPARKAKTVSPGENIPSEEERSKTGQQESLDLHSNPPLE